MMGPENEKQLVENSKTDPESFAKLYDYYYPQIFRYIQRRTGSIGTAQDITSEVFFKALNNIAKFRWRGIPFSAWLYRIANNEIANNTRKRKHRLLNLEAISGSCDLASIPDDTSIEDELINAEAELNRYKEYLVVQENISMLSRKYQEVIMLRFFENKSIKEIQEILGKREGTVKSLLHRGLQKLKTMME
ncbi:MAG: RNA polymerase sigma factor [Dehalococcoidales bacterium]|nr:RNA polymerase sigma factor [Dehalococcoidales bacterium]